MPNRAPAFAPRVVSQFEIRAPDAVDALLYLILELAGDGIEESKVHYV